MPHSCAFFAQEWDSTGPAYEAFSLTLFKRCEESHPFARDGERMRYPQVLEILKGGPIALEDEC